MKSRLLQVSAKIGGVVSTRIPKEWFSLVEMGIVVYHWPYFAALLHIQASLHLNQTNPVLIGT